MEWLLAALVFGSFWFWCAIVVLCFAIVFFDENENYISATISVGLFIALMYASGVIPAGFGVFGLVAALAIYLTLGVIWSFIKWLSYVTLKRDKLIDLRKEWATAPRTQRDFTNVSPDIKEKLGAEARSSLIDHLRGSSYFDTFTRPDEGIIPTAAGNKGRIITWMILWPWSAIWTLINDPVRRACKFIYQRLARFYESIANRTFDGVDS